MLRHRVVTRDAMSHPLHCRATAAAHLTTVDMRPAQAAECKKMQFAYTQQSQIPPEPRCPRARSCRPCPNTGRVPVLHTCVAAVSLALVLRFSPVMGFIKDKVVAPLAGHVAKHTSPELGHKAVDALGADKVAKAMSDYLGPEASVKMMDEAGPEHLADVLGPDNVAALLTDILKLGDPKNRQMIVSIGPQRMAAMLKQLGNRGAVHAVLKMGPATTASTTMTVPGPQLGADLFRFLGDDFAAGLLSGLGPVFVGSLMRAAGPAAAGGFLRGMGPAYTAAVFKLTGPDFLGQVFMIMEATVAGQVLAGAGVDYDASLFNLLGADYVARLMHKTGADFQAEMLRALGVDNSTKLFEPAGAPFVAALLKSLGPDFNACLVGDMGKGAVLLGIDLGASFLAQVASHSDASFLASTALATTGELVAKAADKIADTLHLNSSSTTTATAATDTGSASHFGAAGAPHVSSSTAAAAAGGVNTTPTPTVITGPNLATLDAGSGFDQRSKLSQQQHVGHHDIYTHSVKPAGGAHTGGITQPTAAVTGAPAGPDMALGSQGVGVPDGLKTLLQHSTGSTQQSTGRITIRPIHHLP